MKTILTVVALSMAAAFLASCGPDNDPNVTNYRFYGYNQEQRWRAEDRAQYYWEPARTDRRGQENAN